MMDNTDWNLDGKQLLRLKLVDIAGPSLIYVNERPFENSEQAIERLSKIEKYILEGYFE